MTSATPTPVVRERPLPPAGLPTPNALPEGRRAPPAELSQLVRRVSSALDELRQRAQAVAARYPADRDVRTLLAGLLYAAGEDTLACAEYRSLLESAPPNERRRIQRGIRDCEPDPEYLTPGFLTYLNTQKFGLPHHRTYLFRDLERGRQLVRLLQTRTSLRGKRVLDVGSSHGGTVMALAEAGAQAAGVEIDPRRSQVGRERVRELGFDIEWHTGDFGDPGVARRLGTFDGIICQDVLEHVMNPDRVIRHLAQLLRPGGFIYFAVPNKYSPEFILADHHYMLMGISLLARAQGEEYFERATGTPACHYGVGFYRTEKYYRAAFARCGVAIEHTEDYATPAHVLWYAPAISALAERLGTAADPRLRTELNLRILRRGRKVVELYVHSSRVLKALENQPEQLALACQMIVNRICVAVWRFFGVKGKLPASAE